MSTGVPGIVISPYDPRWPEEFEAVRQRIVGALGELAVRVEHIGSTSVPGLAAKDVIDIQVSVADLDDARIPDAFARLGATPTSIVADHVPPGDTHGNEGWRKLYFRPPTSWRPTHLHVRAVGSPNERYALLFRDYLRAAPAAAAAYAQVKTALARLHPDDAEAYYDVKDPVCDLIMEAAERWAADRHHRPGSR
ncbi:GrpB family protein [Pseudactinotalea sp.]|uniref:GrpB family protein n=1 Tax=Pseudactinotalea sp. TaxID=1926260 RepID=UPI003B3A3A39